MKAPAEKYIVLLAFAASLFTIIYPHRLRRIRASSRVVSVGRGTDDVSTMATAFTRHMSTYTYYGWCSGPRKAEGQGGSEPTCWAQGAEVLAATKYACRRLSMAQTAREDDR